ncbi:leukemia inhibitory factor receptor [Pogona vitticeps]
MLIDQISCCLLAVLCLHILNRFATQAKALVPTTPQIHELTPDYISDTLEVKWYEGGSAFPYELNAIWEIHILHKKPLKEAARDIIQSRLTGTEKLLHWVWTSDLPFNCTDHYVRIRYCLVDHGICSEWSELAKIPGKDSGMYPIDKVVPMGTDMTFCCVWKRGESMTTINYGGCRSGHCWTETLTEQSMALHAEKVALSPSSGFNAWCLAETTKDSDESIYGTVLFVGYPPDVPKKLDCTAQNSEEIMCQWQEGRRTNLYGTRGTHYFLIEQFSGKNITCIHVRRGQQHFQCNFPVLTDQTKYHFTLEAYNNLGHSKASVLLEID